MEGRAAAAPTWRPTSFALGAVPALLVAIAVAAWTMLHGVDHGFITFSDGVYTYLASVVATHGPHVLYRDVALSQPPGGVLAGALAWRLSPHVETIRLLLAALGALTVALTYRVATSVFELAPGAAALAAVVALAGPVHAQFVGLDGEAVLTPLALALALALENRRTVVSGLLVGLGFLFKLTWAPFALAALVVRRGTRMRIALCALVTVAFAYGVAVRAFGWPVRDLVTQVLVAESGSGLQLRLLPSLAAVVLGLWWPLLALAPIGLRASPRLARALVWAGAACALAMVKQGTFFNVLEPLEPLLGTAAVAGALRLWERGGRAPRAAVAVCALGLAAHAASLAGWRALPPPIGAAVVNVHDAGAVDRAAAAIDAHSRPGDRVLVNPLLALVAHRREPDDQADWFILRALERSCPVRFCTEWSRIKARRVPVLSVDSNVVGFDPAFRADTRAGRMRRVLSIDVPPLTTTLLVR